MSWAIRVSVAEADAIGYTFTLALRAGLTAADVVGKMGRIESVLKTRPGIVRVLPDTGRADRAFVRWGASYGLDHWGRSLFRSPPEG